MRRPRFVPVRAQQWSRVEAGCELRYFSASSLGEGFGPSAEQKVLRHDKNGSARQAKRVAQRVRTQHVTHARTCDISHGGNF